MQPTSLIQVLPDIARWSVWNDPRKLWFNGHALTIDGVHIVVDPVPLSDEVAAALPPPSICIITNRDHERAAEEIRRRFGARVMVPRGDAGMMSLAGDPLDEGETIAGLRAVRVAGAKTPGELALYWPARRLLIVGDAAVGRPAGALSLLPADKFPDVDAARAGVARLADLGVDIVLVGDGDDVLAGGAAALAALGAGPAKAPTGMGAPGC